jgi:hypothetical protein
MGWAHGVIDGRQVGYAVEAACDADGCDEKIDRGLAFRCGSQPDVGCNGYFCGRHLSTVVGRDGFWCDACLDAPTCPECGGDLDEAMYDDGTVVVECPPCTDAAEGVSVAR